MICAKGSTSKNRRAVDSLQPSMKDVYKLVIGEQGLVNDKSTTTCETCKDQPLFKCSPYSNDMYSKEYVCKQHCADIQRLVTLQRQRDDLMCALQASCRRAHVHSTSTPTAGNADLAPGLVTVNSPQPKAVKRTVTQACFTPRKDLKLRQINTPTKIPQPHLPDFLDLLTELSESHPAINMSQISGVVYKCHPSPCKLPVMASSPRPIKTVIQDDSPAQEALPRTNPDRRRALDFGASSAKATLPEFDKSDYLKKEVCIFYNILQINI